MKKILPIILLLFIASSYANGSDLDIVKLKNGSILKGIITQQDSLNNVTIILPGGVSVELKGENVASAGKETDVPSSNLMNEMLKRDTQSQKSIEEQNDELYDKTVEFLTLHLIQAGEGIKLKDKEQGKIIAKGFVVLSTGDGLMSIDVKCQYSVLVRIKDAGYTVDFPKPSFFYTKRIIGSGISAGDPIEENDYLNDLAWAEFYKLEAELDRYLYDY